MLPMRRDDVAQIEVVDAAPRRERWLGELEDHVASAGSKHAQDLGEVALSRSGRLRTPKATVTTSNARIVERQVLGVGLLEARASCVPACSAAFCSATASISGVKSVTTTSAGRAWSGDRERDIAGARTQIEHARIRSEASRRDEPAAPGPVDAHARQHVERIVAVGDAREDAT